MQKSSKKVGKNPVSFLFFLNFFLTDRYDLAPPKICSRPPQLERVRIRGAFKCEKRDQRFPHTSDYFQMYSCFIFFSLKELYLEPVLHSLVGSGGEAGSGAGVELVSAVGVV